MDRGKQNGDGPESLVNSYSPKKQLTSFPQGNDPQV
jgi:hypothetical protein